MAELTQSPTDPDFVQDPYPFYAAARAQGDIHVWADYGKPCAFSHRAVSTLLKDRRFGREIPAELARPMPAHLAPFEALERTSMLSLEPPAHSRLRGLVLRAFTSRRIAAMGPEIAQMAQALAEDFPDGPFDLIPAYSNRIPVLVICRLLGVPESMADRLLAWSNAMVAMYQARRDRAVEDAAARASAEFTDFMQAHVDARRARPADDLITQLIAAEEAGDKLSTEELIGTCILLLNAGHEATVHSIGNAVKLVLERGLPPDALSPGHVAATVEEILRYDPPLHMFSRYAYEEAEVFGHRFQRGDEVGLLLAAANRDPAVWDNPETFDPGRAIRTHTSLGGGLHFCVGAPLARLELQIALPILLARHPGLKLAEPPRYANVYHFHGLGRLMVRSDQEI